MRKVLLIATVILASIVPVAAGQQTAPPQAAPPTTPPSRPTIGVVPMGQTPAMPVVATTPGQRGAAPTPPPGQNALPAIPTPSLISQSSTWQNIKLEVTIADSLYADVQTKKTVSMIILDGRSGQVRSSGGDGLINIDARPSVQRDGRIYVQLTVEYRPELTNQQSQQARTAQPSEALRITTFSESLALIVHDGKPILASQSADPRSDRKVSLEITATVVK